MGLLGKPVIEGEFYGAIYDKEQTANVFGNREAEAAVVNLILTNSDAAEVAKLMDRLSERDFNWADTKFIFSEAVLMRNARQPVNDPASWISWYKRNEVIIRFCEAGLDDWKDSTGAPVPLSMVHCVAIDGAFSTFGLADWYVAELRRWRISRGARMLGYDLIKTIDGTPDKPLAVIEWLEGQLKQLKSLVVDGVTDKAETIQ